MRTKSVKESGVCHVYPVGASHLRLVAVHVHQSAMTLLPKDTHCVAHYMRCVTIMPCASVSLPMITA